jgi:hypothetical protein
MEVGALVGDGVREGGMVDVGIGVDVAAGLAGVRPGRLQATAKINNSRIEGSSFFMEGLYTGGGEVSRKEKWLAISNY